ncbi:CBM20 domain-containing protein [Durusdinium trenchii]|uniref:CBM20 domain-containing protein n=1 Tax=Durusdinium trenchii TaxID=1381693 RepID=A0ABP0PWW5_9DINO
MWVRHRFVVSVKDAKPGDRVFVVGSVGQLGHWKMHGARELKTQQGLFPKWQVEVEMEQAPFEYKYVWQHAKGGHLEWENITNRIYSLQGPLEVAEFNRNESVTPAGSYVCFHGYYAHAEWAQQEFASLKFEVSQLRDTMQMQAKDTEQWRTRYEENVTCLERQRALMEEEKEELRKQLVRQARRIQDLERERDIRQEKETQLETRVVSLLDLLRTCQADLEAQKRSTDRLRRDLSDFRALVPEAEELKMEINEALMQDMPKIVASLVGEMGCNAAHTLTQTNAEQEDAKEYSDATPHELQAAPRPPPPGPSFGANLEPDPATNPTARKKDEEASRLTQRAVDELMSLWKGSQEEKAKLLKNINLRLHPDKGGSDEAMIWFEAWKARHRAWYLRGPVHTPTGCCKQQRAG